MRADKALFLFVRYRTERRKMKKITFNDATELAIQSADIRSDDSLLIKTILATEEELRNKFQDSVATKKMIVAERGTIIETYENYTQLDAVVKYTAGILGVVLYKVGETPEEQMESLKEENDKLKENMDMLQECILEMSEQVYQ